MENKYEDPKLFGDFIFRLRRKYNKSRKYVAKQLGFNSESSIMNFERGTTTMKPLHVFLFCKMALDNITVPILYSMFEANSVDPPCRCVCHHDLNNAVPSIYDSEGRCSLCEHEVGDGRFSDNGHWFASEKGKEE